MSAVRREEPNEGGSTGTQAAGKAELSSRPVRPFRTRPFHVALFMTPIAFAALTYLVWIMPLLPIDLQIAQAVQSIDLPGFATLMQVISWPGFAPQSIIITLLVALTLYSFRLRWEAATSLLGTTFSGLINQTMKVIIQRPRPPAEMVDVFSILGSYSYPSGHVMFYLSLFGFVWFLVLNLMKRSWIRSFLLGFFGGLLLLVGISRVYLGHHWATDVLGAYLLGSLILTAILSFYGWRKTRFFVDQTRVLE